VLDVLPTHGEVCFIPRQPRHMFHVPVQCRLIFWKRPRLTPVCRFISQACLAAMLGRSQCHHFRTTPANTARLLAWAPGPAKYLV